MSLNSSFARESSPTALGESMRMDRYTTPLPESDLARRGLSEIALARAQAFIADHLYERFTLSDLARSACMSRYHFARRFRVSTGCSAMEYAMKARMEEAKRILVRGDLKLSETAAALCFCDQSHFTRTFRRMTGLSPGAFSHLHMASSDHSF